MIMKYIIFLFNIIHEYSMKVFVGKIEFLMLFSSGWSVGKKNYFLFGVKKTYSFNDSFF